MKHFDVQCKAYVWEEKLHFLTGKNDGKVSLRGYMHTNWPQARADTAQLLLGESHSSLSAWKKSFLMRAHPGHKDGAK